MSKLKLTEILKMEKTHVNEGFHNFFIRTFSWGLKISRPVNPIIVALRLSLHDSFTISHGTSNHVSHVRPCLFKPAYWSLSFKCLEPEYTVVYECTLQARSVKSRFLRTHKSSRYRSEKAIYGSKICTRTGQIHVSKMCLKIFVFALVRLL